MQGLQDDAGFEYPTGSTWDGKGYNIEFAIGSVLCGVFIGFVIGVKLILESIRFKRDEYHANKGSCLACGRCYEYCPVGKKAKG